MIEYNKMVEQRFAVYISGSEHSYGVLSDSYENVSEENDELAI